MRVGIMSMQRILNYGSYMQALSLKTMIESLGHTVEFIDYRVEPTIFTRKGALRQRFKALIFRVCGTDFVWLLLNLLHRRPLSFRPPKTINPFEAVFVPCYTALGIDYQNKKYRSKVDVLIIGSDEVFNCLQKNKDVGYSLELFGKNNNAKKLISYAASFGDTTLDRLKQFKVDRQIGKLLQKFDCISVRDENSKSIVCKLTSADCLQHLDPVLVGTLEKMSWKGTDKQGYVAVYAYSNRINEAEGIAITNFGHSKSLSVCSINGSQKFCENIPTCTPNEIIPYFQSASYVVTDTFHGIIFSVICHKQFAVFVREPKDNEYSNSAKITDLLKKLGLENRRVRNLSDLGKVLDEPINYDHIESIRAAERERTLSYLKMNIC